MDFKLSQIYATFVHALETQIQGQKGKQAQKLLGARLAACEKRLRMLQAYQKSRATSQPDTFELAVQVKGSSYETVSTDTEIKRMQDNVNKIHEQVSEYVNRQCDVDESGEALDNLGKLVALSQSKEASRAQYAEMVDQWQEQFDGQIEELKLVLKELSRRAQALMSETACITKKTQLVYDNLASRAENGEDLVSLVAKPSSELNDSQVKRKGFFARLFGGR